MGFKKAVFLDRDGTLIIDKIYLNDPDNIEYLPGVFESIKSLSDAGYMLIVVTNQSGVAKGIVSLENLDEIHRRISVRFETNRSPIAGFYYAPFPSDQPHPMRKPNPGMLLQAASEHGIDLKSSWMVGDRWTDVEAGHRAGCRSIFLKGTEEPSTNDGSVPIADTLADMARIVLSTP